MKTVVALALIGAVLAGGYYISKPHYSAGGTPEDVNLQFQKALQNETDPVVLRAFAKDLRAKGYATQATALETKATALERTAQALPGPQGGGIPPMPPPPAVIPTNPPVQVTPGGGVVINVPAPPAGFGGTGNFMVNAGPPTNALNLRSTPNNVSSDNIIVGLPDGTVVTQIGGPTSVGGITWVQVRNPVQPNQTGWVASQYLKAVGLAA